METLLAYLPSVGTVAAVILGLFLLHRLLARSGGGGAGQSFRNQIISWP